MKKGTDKQRLCNISLFLRFYCVNIQTFWGYAWVYAWCFMQRIGGECSEESGIFKSTVYTDDTEWTL